MKNIIDTKIYAEKAKKRLAHVKSHVDVMSDNIQNPVQHILQGSGNPRACAMSLSAHAQASAMFAWFQYHDLPALKQWCYVASKLDQLYYKMQESDPDWGRGFPQLLKPLLSNNEVLINWFANYDLAYDMKRVENHKTLDFWAYQANVALRGDWQQLIARCEKVINDPPGSSVLQKYLIDHHFYLALGRGNIAEMEEVLAQIASPKAMRGRTNDESGFTEDLISTPAVIYSKIAWLHGYQVKVDSPYVPMEWLPMEPLAQYDKHYDFLKS
ncbi:immunity protein 49 of polymorphic toxin system [Collimonas sp. PA-H2]|uniref:Imm49 family immunity protein n=1 Tax=Collimonas sp. PA-H2 TaxID=1881062 RepID=UPI000BF4DD86|nr:Imm49 family immunity protein [Collimonas sp. PA-H2]PFH10119.1 immunity protein 49 of polymorphic toxin system [Collimonas sp. PA-H2]